MNEQDIRDAARTFVAMRQEYAPPEDGIFDTDTPRVAAAKRIVAGLDTADQALFVLYADTQSLRRVAKMLGVSRGSVHKEITRIRKTLLERYEHLRADDIA